MHLFQRHTLLAEMRRTSRIGLPLIGAQLLQMGNGLVDAVIAGRISGEALAAGGIASSLWFVVSLSCIGLMAGLSPTLSRLIGQNKTLQVGLIFRQGLWLGFFTGVLALGILLFLANTLHRFPFDASLPALMKSYLIGACWSLPFFALLMCARNLCEACGFTRPVLIVTALGLLINIIANLALGLGWFGFPRLELLGIGIATTLVNIGMFIALFWLIQARRFSRFALFGRFDRPKWEHWHPLLNLSVPIFLGMLFEAGLFVATAIQMGMIGVVPAGAHQIAISASAFTYMLPLGMSFALTARLSRAATSSNIHCVRLRLVSGAVLLIIMALITVLSLVVFRHEIASIYTNDEELIQFAASLLLLGALFQLSDGAQIMLIGALRGLYDTRVPMLINAFAYWIVAFGLGMFCAYGLNWGAHGLWAGLVIGLTTASILLYRRLSKILIQVERSFADV